jgi:hypothetical protein
MLIVDFLKSSSLLDTGQNLERALASNGMSALVSDYQFWITFLGFRQSFAMVFRLCSGWNFKVLTCNPGIGGVPVHKLLVLLLKQDSHSLSVLETCKLVRGTDCTWHSDRNTPEALTAAQNLQWEPQPSHKKEQMELAASLPGHCDFPGRRENGISAKTNQFAIFSFLRKQHSTFLTP